MRTPFTRARTLAGALIGLMLVGVATPSASAATGFVDVSDDHPFATEIRWMADAGISNGWSTGSGNEYRPSATITRDAMAAFLYRYAGSPSFSAPRTPSFSDVTPETSEFYKEIEWLAAEGISTGWSDGTFRPLRSVSRDAMAAFLFRFADGEETDAATAFADSDTSEHAVAIEWLATQGISEGWLNWRGRVFKPKLSIARDAMAAFLYRLEHGAEPVLAHEPVFESRARVYVTASTVYVRSKPSSSAGVKAMAYKNATGMFDGAREYGWQRVEIGGTVGWIQTTNLTRTKPSSTTQRIGLKSSEIVVRDSPSTSGSVLLRISQGERGQFLNIRRNGEWWQVRFRDTVGWVKASKLNLAPKYNASKALAKAWSQVGYRSPDWNNNKFNDWAGGDNPWCMVYQMWVMDQIGFPQGVPFELLFSDWAKEAMASGVVDTDVKASDLQPGDIVLVDWAPYNGPTHTGMVDHVVNSTTVVLVEGNTLDGTGDRTRGVYVRTRQIVDMYGVFDPDEYARVHGY
ncbi:S-layer homology domain-containing protein [Demequina sp. SYSU T00039]|uniref:S-layer homology domain-containing protein n=1 Tax=Demequina lignilytica TaxID=3051663 RepID=A0AAW7M4P5_9MICO|nr:S-layer homology domain-containing protein [Demequina sp. SYSU T00039]MDN4486721.1 S-layer homology domain-containing protein [Demequina sp. SYSU T00039]